MDWIALVSSVAGFVTAVAALLTVLEMKRQRFTLYKPDLTITSAALYVYAGTYSNIGNSVHCSTARYDLPSDAPSTLPSLRLECFNVGLGAAKDLEIHWRFELEGMLAALKRLTGPHGLSVEYGEYGFTLIDAAGKPFLSSRTSSFTDIIPYALPVHVQSTPLNIGVPSEYTEAIAICASYYVEPHSNEWNFLPAEFRPALHAFPQLDGIETIIIPPATIKLLYHDIGGKIHSREFEVTPTFSHLQQLPLDRDHIREIGVGQLRVFPAGEVTKLFRDRDANRAKRHVRGVDSGEASPS